MKYLDEFRSEARVKKCAGAINKIMPGKPLSIMEVCGTHTQNFFRYSLDRLLPCGLKFIAGPGCPVCVSSQEYIDQAVAYAEDPNAMVLTFGDMMRVPGSVSNLEEQRARNGNVLVMYSPLDALTLAKEYPGKMMIVLAVGFETTASAFALSILEAKREKLKNICFFTSLKKITPAMKYLLEDEKMDISGFMCPGHVSAITGSRSYDFIAKDYRVGCCVTGFEPLDILEGIYLIVRQINRGIPKVENQYSRVVTRNGNLKAQGIMSKVFCDSDAKWRGMGDIAGSGMEINDDFAEFDARRELPVKVMTRARDKEGGLCKCQEIIKGLASPDECALFAKRCSPERPYGPCMVSVEGTCNAYYKYQRHA